MATRKLKAGTALGTVEGNVGSAIEHAAASIAGAGENSSSEGSTGIVTAAPVLNADDLSSQIPAAPTDEEQSGGTHTPASESGDAAGEALAELVKPQGNDEPAPAVPADAATRPLDPEVEASASGTLSSAEAFLKQGMTPYGFEHDGVLLTVDEFTEIAATAVKEAIEARRAAMVERRSFTLVSSVRLDNVLVEGDVPLTEIQHGELLAAGAVDVEWEDGI
ncbi:hypothetical protein [Rhizobium leguminosarum]|uniref:hypothetical protein n=1 Tax=Rhizobium leguminosarum TaxID=384 RepID=UPI001610F578|nr:hypothetical protein [Rhizobium leguminosarum]MBB4465449.1 hypothetical protein [Rhizobium leguminosarum]MBB4472111.1 hypothetical protein [Rhizobium leguminosarum]MBY5416947.1 hypothetical protein [Rhizobium leguminosarum]